MNATITLHLTRDEAIALAHELRDYWHDDDSRAQILNALCDLLDIKPWDA